MRRHRSASRPTGSARLAIQIRCPETSPSGELNTSAKSETKEFKESNLSQPAENPKTPNPTSENVHKQQKQIGERASVKPR